MRLGKKILLVMLSTSIMLQGPMTALSTEASTYELDEGDLIPEIETRDGYEYDIGEVLEGDADDDMLDEEDILEDGDASEDETSEADDWPPMVEEEDLTVVDNHEDEIPEEPVEENPVVLHQRTGVIVVGNANFRRGPSSDDELIDQIPVNTNIRITGYRGTWYRIVHNGMTGWVARTSIQETRQTAIVSGDQSPLRADHDANAHVLAHISRGTPVLIEQRTANWARITINNQTGWLHINDLTIANGRRPGRTRNAIELHERPDASSTVVQRLLRHQEVMILQRTTNGNAATQGWTQVTIRHANGTQIGWVRTNQVEQRVQTRRTRGARTVPVRSGPGTHFSEHRRINVDTQVTVLAEAGSWSHVRFNQNGVRQYGWVGNSRLTRIDIRETITLRRTGITVVNNVNLRRGPSSDYATIHRISVNANVRITGRRGSWYRIVHNGTTGWVARSNIQQTRQTAIVRANHAPIRASRSTNGRILTRAARGTRVTINQRTENWAQVTVNRQTGWIRINHLTIANGRRPGRTTGQVNLRARPNASSTIRRRLPRHQEVMIIQRTINGSAATQGWTQVVAVDASGTHAGWIRTNQVEQRNQTRRTRGVGTVPVRSGPGTNFSIERRINRNVQVTVLAESGNWSHVRFNQNGVRRYGWIVNTRLARIHSRVTTLTHADSLLYSVLVNRDFKLASNFVPNDMRVVNVLSINGTHRMRSTAARQVERLFQFAERSGHTLLATSGFRSYETQRITHNHWINVLGREEALRVSAPPGHSEHQLGLTLDISTHGLGGALSTSFSSTPEGRWLRNNAHHYGFIIRYPRNREADTGFAYEPWHIRFVGVQAATQIFNRGLILEEFLGH